MSDLIRREDIIERCEFVIEIGIANDFGEHDITAEYVKAVVEQIPSAHEWKPCSKEQPKKNGEYLVTLQFKWAKEIDIGEWLDGRWIGLYADDIVAWMDLPEVWEEGSDES